KEQCVWLHRFSSLQHARAVIGNWINQYNTIRPHQALDYLSPAKYLNSLLCKQAA
ncbi:IS3 family transposase, partial [Spartobacteria bacterium LR76]